MRLGTVVRNRRNALQLTQREAADAAGFSDMTWFKVERGDVVSERTLIGVDRALRWEPGSAQDVLDGGEPTNAEPGDKPSIAERLDKLEAELADLRARLAGRPGNGESKTA